MGNCTLTRTFLWIPKAYHKIYTQFPLIDAFKIALTDAYYTVQGRVCRDQTEYASGPKLKAEDKNH